MVPAPSLVELIGKYLDRAATDAEVAELTRRLREDPDAADAFARACRRDAWLSKRFREQRNGEHFRARLEETERNGQRSRHGRRFTWAAATAVAAAAVAALCWAVFGSRYPQPQATGTFTIREGGPLRRGALVEAGSEGATLALGGYCHIAMDPNSVVRVSGTRRRERIVLERGRVVCEVERGAGQFTVETERCTVSVRGTRFSVELLGSEGEQAMLGKQVLVKVFAGAVLVAAAGAQGVVAAGEGKLVPGDLTIAAKDLPLEVGRRTTYTVANPAGEPVGEVGLAVVGKRTVGANTLCRGAVRFGAMRVGDFWAAVDNDGFAFYSSFGATLPDSKYPLPLKEGMAFDYESTRGKVRARVVGTEAVEVPAGKFACLAIVREREADGQKKVEKEWMAPGVGTVKASGDDFVMTLARAEAPPKPKVEEGAVVLNTFDTPDPLRSPLFPRGVWTGLVGEPGRSSVVDVDPFTGGANGTPFCLRWTYATIGTWASAHLPLGGDGRTTPVDMSKYKGISFYIKGLFEQPCTVTIHAKAADKDRRTMIHIPIQVTKQWRKVVLTPNTHPQMKGIDTRQTYILSLDDAADEPAANVIWLDEIKLHENAELLREEIEVREKVKRLLDGKKADF